jgi:hypothetical protein
MAETETGDRGASPRHRSFEANDRRQRKLHDGVEERGEAS